SGIAGIAEGICADVRCRGRLVLERVVRGGVVRRAENRGIVADARGERSKCDGGERGEPYPHSPPSLHLSITISEWVTPHNAGAPKLIVASSSSWPRRSWTGLGGATARCRHRTGIRTVSQHVAR